MVNGNVMGDCTKTTLDVVSTNEDDQECSAKEEESLDNVCPNDSFDPTKECVDDTKTTDEESNQDWVN